LEEIIDFDKEIEYLIINNFFHSYLPEFNEVYEAEKKNLPYHINLLDEIHANENAHSRILMKLLNAKDSEYFILKSFLLYLGEPFSRLILKDIKITCEKNRIDICVLAKDFALIVENKIHGAVDQEEQIISYVTKVKSHSNSRYKSDKNIYVLYLGGDSEERPSKSSLPTELEDELKSRFKIISYRNTILPWLESNIIANCKSKDRYLSSAIMQYIDHLNGMYNLRKEEKNMTEKLKKHIIEKLDLNNKNLHEQLEDIYSKEQEVRKILQCIEDIKIDKEKERNISWIKGINKRMIEDFPKFVVKDVFEGKWPMSYIDLNCKNWPPIRLVIQTDLEDRTIYFGISIINKREQMIQGLIQELIKDNYFSEHDKYDDESNDWYWSRYSEYDDVYLEFKKMFQKLIELLK